jgi:hypothetical protein
MTGKIKALLQSLCTDRRITDSDFRSAVGALLASQPKDRTNAERQRRYRARQKAQREASDG